MTTAAPRVVFRAAAGPGRGFGHLVRCRVLARALGVTPLVSLRAPRGVLSTARRLGCRLWQGGPASLAADAIDLLVIDDPSARHARVWVRAAKDAGVPVASIHDAGTGLVRSDLTIDGSLVPVSDSRRSDLQGPAFAIVDAAIARRRALRASRRPRVVLVTLGGGRHVRVAGVRVAAAIRRAVPEARLDIVQGFGPAPAGRLPAGCRWVTAPRGLARALSMTSVAVVAGGVTLYEACALGMPVVALAVVPAQRPAARAFANAGAAFDASDRHPGRAASRAAAFVALLLQQPHVAARLGARARALVDAHGAARVAVRLRALIAARRATRFRHVA